MELEEIKQNVDENTFMAIQSIIEAEKNKGIELHQKVNNEAKNLRRFKTSIEALGYAPGSDLDSFTAGLINKVSTPNDEDSKLTLESLGSKVRQLQNELTEEKNRSSELSRIAKHKTIQNKLYDSLNTRVYGADLLIDNLINQGKVDMINDDVVFIENDAAVSYDSGIQKLLEARKDILKNTQSPGAGTVNNSKGDLNPDISSILQSNDKQTIAQNLGAIKNWIGMK